MIQLKISIATLEKIILIFGTVAFVCNYRGQKFPVIFAHTAGILAHASTQIFSRVAQIVLQILYC